VKATVVNLKKEGVGEVDLNEGIFATKGGTGKIYDVVKMQRASRRKGSAATRNHALVSGTTAKAYRQKGTGRARHGDYRTNIFVGGGKSFGPHPRDYSYNVPKKVKRGALRSVLAEKHRDGKMMVVDEFNLPQIKTKAFVETIKALGVENSLIILDESNVNLEKSARNVPGIKVLRCEGLNVMDVIRYDNIIFTKPALAKVQEVLKP
jgi:large subunit ribosomal protein L4